MDKFQNSSTISKVIRSFIPPIINDYIASKKWSFEGNYSSFEEASSKCKGYSDKETVSEIKKKFTESIKSRSGRQIFLDQYDQQLLSAFFIATRALVKNHISVLDLGGGFGIHYHQIKNAAGSKMSFKWDVVETAVLANEATAQNRYEELSFYDNIGHLVNNRYDIILTSGTLQYLPDPFAMFRYFQEIQHQFLIINRFPLIDEPADRLTIQNVPKSYYSASFPSWFFSSEKWISAFEKEYKIDFRWFCMSEIYLGMQKVPFQGLLLDKR
jgi:putative methyltransferase (TIGR04325 family)